MKYLAWARAIPLVPGCIHLQESLATSVQFAKSSDTLYSPSPPKRPAMWWLLLCPCPRTLKQFQKSCYSFIHLPHIYYMLAVGQEISPGSPEMRPFYNLLQHVDSCFPLHLNLPPKFSLSIVVLKCLNTHKYSSFQEGETNVPRHECGLVCL